MPKPMGAIGLKSQVNRFKGTCTEGISTQPGAEIRRLGAALGFSPLIRSIDPVYCSDSASVFDTDMDLLQSPQDHAWFPERQPL